MLIDLKSRLVVALPFSKNAANLNPLNDPMNVLYFQIINHIWNQLFQEDMWEEE